MFKTYPRKIDSVLTSGTPGEEITLYGFCGYGDSASSISIASAKVELFLRMNDLPYKVELGQNSNKKLAPKGKVPSLKHGEDIIPDSTFILRYLGNTYGDKLKVYEPSDKSAGAVARAAVELCQETLYYACLWYRWMTPQGWKEYQKLVRTIVPGVPAMFIRLLMGSARGQVDSQLYNQGMGRHSMEDINYLMEDAVNALANLLGDQPYIAGQEPSHYDCTVFGTLDSMLFDGFGCGFDECVKKHPNLVAYDARIRDKYFPKENPSALRGLEYPISKEESPVQGGEGQREGSLMVIGSVLLLALLIPATYHYIQKLGSFIGF